ncbi:hypothetical protein BX666DRAFT_2130907 [Dichotomocladium elegans]|nr:hypothetical protein BX666DRAFT_2130907 [Dichotomocladium elegans]
MSPPLPDRIRSIPWSSFTASANATTDPGVLQQQQSYWLYDHPRQHHDIVATTSPASAPLSSSHPLPKRRSQQQLHARKSGDATPRRYKCSVCDKRFSRPSSLATHMHSHTGEKPYTCQVEGCGRRFSVVSNLRRHAKIHITKSSP